MLSSSWPRSPQLSVPPPLRPAPPVVFQRRGEAHSLAGGEPLEGTSAITHRLCPGSPQAEHGFFFFSKMIFKIVLVTNIFKLRVHILKKLISCFS